MHQGYANGLARTGAVMLRAAAYVASPGTQRLMSNRPTKINTRESRVPIESHVGNPARTVRGSAYRWVRNMASGALERYTQRRLLFINLISTRSAPAVRGKSAQSAPRKVDPTTAPCALAVTV